MQIYALLMGTQKPALLERDELMELVGKVRRVIKLSHLALATDESSGRIIGMATLTVCHRLAGDFGCIEDVIVDAEYRSQGIEHGLVEILDEKAKNLGLKPYWAE